MSEKAPKDIYLRSEEFQEVLGWVPPWILRWGITLLGFIILLLLFGSMIFKYPDVISSRMTLTGSVPPAALMAKTTGKIKELYVGDNHFVKEGSYLAVLENPAQTTDILQLKDYISNSYFLRDSGIHLPPRDLQLGTLQSLYSTFYLTLFEYKEFCELNYFPTKEKWLHQRIAQYQEQYINLQRQQKITEEQHRINRLQYERDSTLFISGVIANESYENTKSQYLQSSLAYETLSSSITQMEIQIDQLKESLFENSYQYIEKRNNYLSTINTLTMQLKAEIQNWEINYALVAPVSGQVTFTNYWVINQNVIAGENIVNIIPTDSVELLGKALLPTSRSGKVKTGQKVNIRFDNFPDNEFGIVKGIVRNISMVPARNNDTPVYVVEVELPEGLKTNYRKELPYLPQMEATADIITDDISAFQRFIQPIRKVLTEGFQE